MIITENLQLSMLEKEILQNISNAYHICRAVAVRGDGQTKDSYIDFLQNFGIIKSCERRWRSGAV